MFASPPTVLTKLEYPREPTEKTYREVLKDFCRLAAHSDEAERSFVDDAESAKLRRLRVRAPGGPPTESLAPQAIPVVGVPTDSVVNTSSGTRVAPVYPARHGLAMSCGPSRQRWASVTGASRYCVHGHLRSPETVVAPGCDPAVPESRAAEVSSVDGGDPEARASGGSRSPRMRRDPTR